MKSTGWSILLLGLATTLTVAQPVPQVAGDAPGKTTNDNAAAVEAMKLSLDSAAEQISGQVGGEFAVTKRLIDDLPINGRNYVQFALTNSQVKHDSAPSISDLPTSGLSINGQRGRFNLSTLMAAILKMRSAIQSARRFPRKQCRNSVF